MALMDFIKKQFIDVIQWTEDSDGTLAWRFPMAAWKSRTAARWWCASRRWPSS